MPNKSKCTSSKCLKAKVSKAPAGCGCCRSITAKQYCQGHGNKQNQKNCMKQFKILNKYK